MKTSILPLVFYLFITLISLYSCTEQEEDIYVPKPTAFHRIDLPTNEFVPSTRSDLPYDFELSKYGVITNDISPTSEPHWIQVKYKNTSAEIHITYKEIKGKKELYEDYVNDSHELAYKHVKMKHAEFVDPFDIKVPNPDYKATVFEIGGTVPTFFQYFVTDTSQHFLRASLYFPTSQKADSLAPIIDYTKVDMMHMLNTLKFKDKK